MGSLEKLKHMSTDYNLYNSATGVMTTCCCTTVSKPGSKPGRHGIVDRLLLVGGAVEQRAAFIRRWTAKLRQDVMLVCAQLKQSMDEEETALPPLVAAHYSEQEETKQIEVSRSRDDDQSPRCCLPAEERRGKRGGADVAVVGTMMRS